MTPADGGSGPRAGGAVGVAEADRARHNRCRYVPGHGHYESYFLRANAPGRPLAFWIRYTIFAPKGDPSRAEGELWALVFDGEHGRIHAGKAVAPLDACTFDNPAGGLKVEVAGAQLQEGWLTGGLRADDGTPIGWTLTHDAPQPPLLLLPEGYYDRGFPKAKALVGAPLARFQGELRLGDRSVGVDGWVGSQNHNWGPQHTDHYAWGQVAGFDDDGADVFLECAMPRLKLGPLWTPFLPVVVVRTPRWEIAINTIAQALRNRGRLDGLSWSFQARDGATRVRATFEGDPNAFVGLRYRNPGGHDKVCLNSKIAACTLEVQEGGETRVYRTRDRAAFEILDDTGRADVRVRV